MAAPAPAPATFEGWLTLPRSWCARFVKNREEAALVVALSRAGISLDLLLQHRQQNLSRAQALLRVQSGFRERLGAAAGTEAAVVQGLSACIALRRLLAR